MSQIIVATTAPYGLILQLQGPPSSYSPAPEYGLVTLKPPSQGGGIEFDMGMERISSPTVDSVFWSIWRAENSQNPLLVNGVVFQS